MDWSNLFDESALQDLQVPSTLVNLILVLLLSQVLAIHYRKFAKVLSNKRKFAPMLIFIAATTMLVISVVKTSLSLSLGLVGALSIIRFRTPIKEPEDLAYLFLSVAVGVGIGADQRIATSIMFIGILLYISVSRWGKNGEKNTRTLVHVSGALGSQNRDGALKSLLACLSPHAAEVDLRRIDVQEQSFDATMSVDLSQASSLGPLLDAVHADFPGASVSVVEADSLD